MGIERSGSCRVDVYHMSGLEGWEEAVRGLSRVELARLGLLTRVADRARSALSARLLREVASSALGCRPDEVPVDRTCRRCGLQHGAPVVQGTGLHVSVSHSGRHVLVAMSDAPVGVDVEALDELTQATSFDALAGVARLMLAPGEAAPRTSRELFTTWTRKEAVVKLTGEGLRRPLRTLRLTAPWQAAGVLAVPSCLRDLKVLDLRLRPDAVGAVATRGEMRLRLHEVDASYLAPRTPRRDPERNMLVCCTRLMPRTDKKGW